MFKELSEVNGNVLTFVAGYLRKKAMLMHLSCKNCNLPLSQENSHFTDLIDLKMYNSDCKMNKPPISFIKYVEELGKVFAANYIDYEFQNQVGLKLFKLLEKVEWNMCPTFPKVYLIKLFIRMRIYHILKKKNQLLKTKIGREKLLKLNYDIRK